MYSGDIGVNIPEKNTLTKVVTEDYTTNGEYLLVSTSDSTITLNSAVGTKVRIKSLSNTSVVPDIGLIDSRWENVELDNNSSVEFVFVSDLNYWVIVSSDGIKDS